jgi:16S rRNA A1518/A1519 N6-dimethyltransferase RsmA/KsgA/DIM1 with predicted DNA glycosylase/AP lyase activity
MPREQRFTFDEVGAQYDRYRPGYPDQLFDDLVSLSGISHDERVLEIGCGTGQATRALARRGFSMSCLEPRRQLVCPIPRNPRFQRGD